MMRSMLSDFSVEYLFSDYERRMRCGKRCNQNLIGLIINLLRNEQETINFETKL